MGTDVRNWVSDLWSLSIFMAKILMLGIWAFSGLCHHNFIFFCRAQVYIIPCLLYWGATLVSLLVSNDVTLQGCFSSMWQTCSSFTLLAAVIVTYTSYWLWWCLGGLWWSQAFVLKVRHSRIPNYQMVPQGFFGAKRVSFTNLERLHFCSNQLARNLWLSWS